MTAQKYFTTITDETLKQFAEETYKDLQVSSDRLASDKQDHEFLQSWFFKACTEMEPWKADNLLDMQNQVKVYLNNLMEVLNKELKECSCCEGTGFLQI